MEIGVLGLGTVGIKLVEYLADKEFSIKAFNYRNLSTKKQILEKNLKKKIKYENSSNERIEEIKSKIKFVSKLSELSSCDIILESLKEEYSIKEKIYSDLSLILNKSTILATTTSSLSLEKLNNDYFNDRFIGIHFFNPPTKMKLIEVSYLKDTSIVAKQKIVKFLKAMDDKIIIEMPVIQGYIVNNLLFSYINHAIEFYDTNNIQADNIDSAMKLGTNAAMGPLELSDYIGNDISLQILNELYSATSDSRFKPNRTLVKMVQTRKLGRKSGEGFYNYR